MGQKLKIPVGSDLALLTKLTVLPLDKLPRPVVQGLRTLCGNCVTLNRRSVIAALAHLKKKKLVKGKLPTPPAPELVPAAGSTLQAIAGDKPIKLDGVDELAIQGLHLLSATPASGRGEPEPLHLQGNPRVIAALDHIGAPLAKSSPKPKPDKKPEADKPKGK